MNSAAGSGWPVEDNFLKATGLPSLPAWCTGYREDLRAAAVRDLSEQAEIRAILEKQGWEERDLLNKTHYTVNAKMERVDCDAAILRRKARS